MRMNAYLRWFILMVVFFSISCGKEEFTKPSDVAFSFEFHGTSEEIDYLRFIRGQLVLEEFEFQGIRENAPNFLLNEHFENGLLVEWPGITTELDFDIPQGIYTSVEISMTLFSPSGSGISAEGVYDRLDDTVVPLTIEIKEEIRIEIKALNKDGGEAIVLSNDRPNQAKIGFRVAEFVRNIKRDSLETASNRAAIPSNPGNSGNQNPPGIARRNEILFSNEKNKEFLEIIKNDIINHLEIVFN